MRLGVVVGGCVLALAWTDGADSGAAKVRWQVAYHGAQYAGLVVQTESGIRQATRTQSADHPLWSPRGRFLFRINYGQPGLYLADTVSRRTRRLTRKDPSAVAWSRDGHFAYALSCVATSCESRIYVAERAGGNPRLVYRTEAQTDVTALALTPNGDALAFISERHGVRAECETCSSTMSVFQLSGGAPRAITTSEPGTYLDIPVWSPDGTLIAYGRRCFTMLVGDDSYCDVAVTTPQGTGQRTLVSQDRKGATPSADTAFVWRPGTKELAFAGWARGVEVALVNAVTGKLRVLHKRAAFDLAFSSDGRQLGYLTRALVSPGRPPRPYEVRITNLQEAREILRHRLASDYGNLDLRLP
jgi:hypothetical protein